MKKAYLVFQQSRLLFSLTSAAWNINVTVTIYISSGDKILKGGGGGEEEKGERREKIG